MKEHDLIKGIFVIVRGSGTESNESSEIMFKEKKGKFDIVSCHNVCTANFRYPTSFVANGIVYEIFIKLSTIKTYIHKYEAVFNYFWYNSLYHFTRLYPNDFYPLN